MLSNTQPSFTDTTLLSQELRPQKQKVKCLNWERGELIAKGAYGHVYMCLDLDTGEVIVAKHIKLTHNNLSKLDQEIESLEREINTLKELAHKNVVHYLHTEVSEAGIAVDIFMEYVQGGSIRSLLNRCKKLNEHDVREYTVHVMQGLVYLHSKGIVHRDLKCANLLLARDDCPS
jgi:serine/threonine protein kinase